MSNYLAQEKSPYLLQHADQPINWHAWSKQSLQKAVNENKLLFISIGYSTCHWCHTMARESFENEEIARLLNEYFIPIKVDREERPDVDAIYMDACIAMNGQGGWPLTVFALPSQQPFFTATYLPFKSENGRIGLFEILNIIIEEWRKGADKFINYATEFTKFLKKQNETLKRENVKGRELFENAFLEYEKRFDKTYGGFSNAPKFPMPHALMFLLRYYYFEKDKKALKMVEKTLESIYVGGIHDHIGGGFCRYSTDRSWLIPHFEKMLYDNALLVIAYAEAYQVTGKRMYKDAVTSTLEFVIRELTSTAGGFWTALDADVEGEEGAYYALRYEEVLKILGEEDTQAFAKHYNISYKGNFAGKNIPNMIGSKDMEASERVMAAKQAMYHFRKKRHKLHIDDKVLMSQNALMISAFVKAYRAIGKESYLTLAEKNIEFLEENLIDDDSNIYRSYREGRSKLLGGLEDYAFYCLALIDLYEVTFKIKYLQRAILFANKAIELFLDTEEGGFFMSDERVASLIYRPKEVFDGAIPSGNSVMGHVLNKLYKLTKKEEIGEQAVKHNTFLAEISIDANQIPFALMALMQTLYPSQEIVTVAENHEDTISLREKQSEFLPNTTYLTKILAEIDATAYADFLWEYSIQNNVTTYYVCENENCRIEHKL